MKTAMGRTGYAVGEECHVRELHQWRVPERAGAGERPQAPTGKEAIVNIVVTCPEAPMKAVGRAYYAIDAERHLPELYQCR